MVASSVPCLPSIINHNLSLISLVFTFIFLINVFNSNLQRTSLCPFGCHFLSSLSSTIDNLILLKVRLIEKILQQFHDKT